MTIQFREAITLAAVSLACTVYAGVAEAKYSLYASWGIEGSGPGQLNNPEDLDIGRDGKVRVLDNMATDGNGIRVQAFERDGSLLKETINSCDAYDSNSLFASSYAKGLHIQHTGTHWVAGTVPGVSSGLGSVWSFKMDESNQCFDYGLIFDTYHLENRFYEPVDDVVTDGLGNIFVADGDACQIQRYSPNGAYTRSYDNNGRPCPYGDAISTDVPVPLCEERAAGFMGSGYEAGWRPSGIAIDSRGNLYAPDRENDYLIKIDTAGGRATKIGRHGSASNIGAPAGDVEFHEPRGVAVDSEDNVYVADWCNGRVQKLSPEGRLLDVMNAGAPVDEVAVDREGFIFALDEDDSTVIVFKPEKTEDGQNAPSQLSPPQQTGVAPAVADAAVDTDFCAVPSFKTRVEARRYLSVGGLSKGIDLTLMSSVPSHAKVRLSLRMNDVNRLGLYRKGQKKTRVIGIASTNVSSSPRSLRVGIPPSIRRALRSMKGRNIRVKATVIFRAESFPRWRQMERRASISIVIKRKGGSGEKKISSTKSTVGISACAERLNVSLRARRGSLTKGIGVRISSSGPASGSLTLELRGRDRSRLGFARNFKKRILRSKIRLHAGRKATGKIRIARKTARALARRMSSRGVRRIRAKIVVSVKGRDGQRAWEAATVRLSK